MKSYQTEYPNQVHQLSVSVSKNYYVTKSGILKYQKKKMEANLNTLESSKKINLIHYLIRDHASGIFYAEISTSEEIKNIVDFLFRAWSKKENFSFQGIPDFLSLPKTVQAFYPDIQDDLEKYEVQLIEPTSGFQGGIGDTKNIEGFLGFSADKDISEAYEVSELACKVNSERKLSTTGLTKLEHWTKFVKEIRLPTNA